MDYFDFVNDPKIVARIIAENDFAFAFPTNIPIVPGHTLICPKRYISTIDELIDGELRALFALQKQLKEAMILAFDAEGFNYAWNEGELAGQSVKHLHLHMLPRKISDSGVIDYEPREFLYRPGGREISPEQELIAIAQLIKIYL